MVLREEKCCPRDLMGETVFQEKQRAFRVSVTRTEHMPPKLTSRITWNTAQGVVCTGGMDR